MVAACAYRIRGMRCASARCSTVPRCVGQHTYRRRHCMLTKAVCYLLLPMPSRTSCLVCILVVWAPEAHAGIYALCSSSALCTHTGGLCKQPPALHVVVRLACCKTSICTLIVTKSSGLEGRARLWAKARSSSMHASYIIMSYG